MVCAGVSLCLSHGKSAKAQNRKSLSPPQQIPHFTDEETRNGKKRPWRLAKVSGLVSCRARWRPGSGRRHPRPQPATSPRRSPRTPTLTSRDPVQRGLGAAVRDRSRSLCGREAREKAAGPAKLPWRVRPGRESGLARGDSPGRANSAPALSARCGRGSAPCGRRAPPPLPLSHPPRPWGAQSARDPSSTDARLF
jgi:hypothetical protein